MDEDTLDEPESDEHDESPDKVDGDPDETLGVEADQHHVLPPESVGEGAEEDPAYHDAAEVDRRDQGCHERAIADQTPLKRRKK